MVISNVNEQQRALNFLLNHIAKAVNKKCIISWESNINVQPMEMTTEAITLTINRTLLDADQQEGTLPDRTDRNSNGDPPNFQALTADQNIVPTYPIPDSNDRHYWAIGDLVCNENLIRYGPVPEMSTVATFHNTYTNSDQEYISNLPNNNDQNNQPLRRTGNGEIDDGLRAVRAIQTTRNERRTSDGVREGSNMGRRYTPAEIQSANLRYSERQNRQVDPSS